MSGSQYSYDKECIGIALLVGNDYIGTAQNELRNTHHDVDQLGKILESFKYFVYKETNISKDKMFEVCKLIAEHAKCKRIIVYFSGHGRDDELLFHPKNKRKSDVCPSVKLETIINLFKPNKANNPELINISRVFLVDACRGGLEEKVYSPEHHNNMKRRNSFSTIDRPKDNDPEAEEKQENQRYPNNGNILIGYSSTPGFISYLDFRIKKDRFMHGSIWTNIFILELIVSDRNVKVILEDGVAKRLEKLHRHKKDFCITPSVSIRGVFDDFSFLSDAKRGPLTIEGNCLAN